MFSKFHRISTAIGIGIKINAEGNVMINACEITVSNKQLNFDKKITGLVSFEELVKQLPGKSPVSLNITGKGVLTKVIETVEEITPAQFSQILPNANFEDFYIQNFVSGNLSYVSVIRKADADKWINELKKSNYQIVMLSVGPFVSDSVLSQLNLYDAELVFDGHMIQLNQEKSWTGYRYEESTLAPFPIKIDAEKIDEKLIVAYAAAFQLILSDRINAVQVNSTDINSDYERLLTSKWIRAYLAKAIIVTFILLLINVFVFSWLYDDNTKLSNQLSRTAQNTTDIRQLEDQVKSKEQKLKILGWTKSLNKSNIIDQLAANLPEELIWKEIVINPADAQKSRDLKTIQFKDHVIQVVGYSPQIIQVNEWMARIKILKWVSAVELEGYSYNTELRSGQFTVLITY